jgi:hypothetical protein
VIYCPVVSVVVCIFGIKTKYISHYFRNELLTVTNILSFHLPVFSIVERYLVNLLFSDFILNILPSPFRRLGRGGVEPSMSEDGVKYGGLHMKVPGHMEGRRPWVESKNTAPAREREDLQTPGPGSAPALPRTFNITTPSPILPTLSL